MKISCIVFPLLLIIFTSNTGKCQDINVKESKAILSEKFFSSPETAVKHGEIVYNASPYQFSYLFFNELIPELASYALESPQFSNGEEVVNQLFVRGQGLGEMLEPAVWWLKAIRNADSPDKLSLIADVFLGRLLKDPNQMQYKTRRFVSSVYSIMREHPALSVKTDRLLGGACKYLKVVDFDKLEYSFGKEFPIQSLKGKWFVMDFWWLGCGSCRMEHPELQAIHTELNKGKDIPDFLTVASDEAPDIAKYMKEKGFDFPVLRTDSKTTKLWGIASWPTKALVFPNGKLLQLPFYHNWISWYNFYTLRLVLGDAGS